MLAKNDIFETNGIAFRLLAIYPVQDIAYVIEMGNDSAMPLSTPYSAISEIQPKISNKKMSELHISEAMATKRSEHFSYVEAMVKHGQKIFDKTYRSQTIEEISKSGGPSKPTSYKILRRFWQGGQTEAALTPSFQNCGRQDLMTTLLAARHAEEALRMTADVKPESSSIVRKNHRDSAVAAAATGEVQSQAKNFMATLEDLKLYNLYIEKYFLTRKQLPLTKVWLILVEEKYSWSDGNGEIHPLPPSERPSYTQFRYFLKRNFTKERILRSRVGDKGYEKDHAPKLKASKDVSLGPGHIYEVDACLVDMDLVSSKDMHTIIGRPTIYIVIDNNVGLIVGMYIGLENASWAAARLAVMSISADKEELCRRLNITYRERDWPAHGLLPTAFMADRGEFAKKNAHYLSELLRIGVISLPGARPDWKALVEGEFKLTHQDLRALDAGYIQPASEGVIPRMSHTSKVWTLEDFEIFMWNRVIVQNNRMMMKFNRTIAERSAHILKTPIDLWNYRIKRTPQFVSRHEYQDLNVALMPRAERVSVGDMGIKFEGLYYSLEDTIQTELFNKQRPTSELKIAFDPRTVDYIFAHGIDQSGKIYKAKLNSHSDTFLGLTRAEAKFWASLEAQEKPADIEHNLSLDLQFQHDMGKRKKASKAKYKENPAKSFSSRFTNAEVARHEEMAAAQKKQLSSEARLPPASKVVASVTSATLNPAPLPLELPKATLETGLQRRLRELSERMV